MSTAAAPLGAVGENRKPLESVMSVNMELRYLLAAEFLIKDFSFPFPTYEDDTKKIEKMLREKSGQSLAIVGRFS